MKRTLLLLGLGLGAIIGLQAATTISITDSTFSAFTGWTCPGTCSGLDTDPYWEYIGTALTQTGSDSHALHIGAYSSNSMGYVYQTDGGYSSSATHYLLSVTYGQWNPYNSYTSPDFSESDELIAYIGTAQSSLTAIGSWSNFYANDTSYGKQFGGWQATATACFNTPAGLPSNRDGVELAGYDTLQDLIVTSVSITSSTCTTGVTTDVVTQVFMDDQWVDVGTDDTSVAPEPRTLVLMALTGAIVTGLYLKFRPA